MLKYKPKITDNQTSILMHAMKTLKQKLFGNVGAK